MMGWNNGVNGSYQVLFSQIADKTISNSDIETSLINTTGARGSLVIPANSLKTGSILKFRIDGIIGDTGTPTATVKIKIGSSILINNTMTLTAFGQNFYFEATFFATIRTLGQSGKICGEGTTIIKDPSTITTGLMRSLNSATDITIDTTIDNTFDLTYKFSAASASNNITSRNFILDLSI